MMESHRRNFWITLLHFSHWIFALVIFGLSMIVYVITTIISLHKNSPNISGSEHSLGWIGVYSENINWGLILLLALPLIIQIFGWFVIYDRKGKEKDSQPTETTNTGNSQESKEKVNNLVPAATIFCSFYSFTMLLSILLYCLMWTIHSLGLKYNNFSYLCLLFIFLQLGVVIFTTFVIMQLPLTGAPSSSSNRIAKFVADWKEQGKKRCVELKEGLHLFPFWRFMHFFSIFMSVSFLFGFAFAFHDESLRNEAKNAGLYLENLKQSSSPTTKNADTNDESANKQPQEKRQGEPSPKTKTIEMGCFYFNAGRAKLEVDGNGSQVNYNNRESLKDLTDKIHLFSSEKLIRISLIGQADENAIEKTASYLSNYELSEARTSIVKDEITKSLIALRRYPNWRNLEWSLIPYSNELVGNSNLFRRCDIINPIELLNKIKAQNTSVSKDIFKGLDEETKKIVLADNGEVRKKALADNKSSMTEIITKIVAVLNTLLEDEDFCKRNSDNLGIKAEKVLALIKNNKTKMNRAIIENSYQNILVSQVLPKLIDEMRLPITKNDPSDISNFRVVESSIEIVDDEPFTQMMAQSQIPPYQPQLMDYMYFSIYTITTTGYGDIKPISQYSKFLVSIENFFEVFFLVCFMNVLISLKNEPPNNSVVR
jgi:hypothetical protein